MRFDELVIALDYDQTYTEDPGLWEAFIKSAKSRGHKVYIATMRHPSEVISDVNSVDIIYTERKAKGPYLDALGINVDIWIDDSPHWILEDSK